MPKSSWPLIISIVFISLGSLVWGQTNDAPAFLKWAPTPPMGWNSWDSFATTITEEQAKAETDYMAEHLLVHGWQYLVVDIQWYELNATGFDYRKDAKLSMDKYGRLLPAPNRFPSAADGTGFKELADYVHAKGLRFGLHMMRGIPRQAVAQNTAILGSFAHAADIADTQSTCSWNGDMYGVDMTKPGAQDYYNSEFQQFADWGVDFVKIDDATLALITNDEVLAVDQHSLNNRLLFRNTGQMAWVADVPNSPNKYLAVFNLADKGSSQDRGAEVPVKLGDLGFNGSCQIRDLWQQQDLTSTQGTFSPILPWHGAGLYRVHEVK